MNATDLAQQVLDALAARGWTLGTCESLTGGLVAAALTEVPGASHVFRGGLVTYASDLKTSLAGVPATQVATRGVVNEATARQMATGARQALVVNLAVSCTGVAGPDPQDGESVGVVWIAVSGPDDGVVVRKVQLSGSRAEIRCATVSAALQLVLDVAHNA